MKRRIMSWIGLTLTLAVVVLCGCRLLKKQSAEEVPAWIKGTLMISSLGAEELPDNDFFTDRYLCAFDFSKHTTESIRIPFHAQFITNRNSPIVLYQRSGIYMYGEVENRREIYQTYMMSNVRRGVKGYEIDKYLETGEFTFKGHPVIVYGIVDGFSNADGRDEKSYYYLGYGVSENGELEYQLTCEKTNGELTIYRSYPLDYDVPDIYVSVSQNGKIAWREIIENTYADVFVSDGPNVYRLPDEHQYTDSICWIDDNRLLYTANATDMSDFHWGDLMEIVPRIWHVDTGIIDDLNSVWKNAEVKIPHSLQGIAIDRNQSLAAGYISPTEDDSDQVGKIIIFSLNNGDSYTYVPWKQSISIDDGFYYTNYVKTDDGAYICDPRTTIDIRLMWINE